MLNSTFLLTGVENVKILSQYSLKKKERKKETLILYCVLDFWELGSKQREWQFPHFMAKREGK